MTNNTNPIESSEDLIDSRDIIARIEYLESIEEDYSEFGREEDAELSYLRETAEQAEGYAPAWNFGATLIRETYFDTYAREYLDEVTDIPESLSGYIDYSKFARDLRVDYTSVELDGVTYYVR